MYSFCTIPEVPLTILTWFFSLSLQAPHLHFHFQNRWGHHRPWPTFNQSQMHVPRHVGRRRLFPHSIAVGCRTTDFNYPVSRNVAIDEQMQTH